jgi:hypothetical protein
MLREKQEIFHSKMEDFFMLKFIYEKVEKILAHKIRSGLL